MNTGLPIFLIHTGNSSILSYSLNQLRFSNPDSDIYLIGDESNKYVEKYGVKHVFVKDYFSQAKEFEKYYSHMSPNPYGYEIFCFQRWMVLDEFVKSINYTGTLLYCDSDVLVFTNISEYAEKYFKGHDVSVNRRQGPQYTLITNDSLSELSSYMIDCFANPDTLDSLKKFYNDTFVARKIHGGVCDMTLLESFAKKKNFFDTNIIRDGAFFDNSTHQAEGFIKKGRLKKIIKKDGEYFGIKNTGEQVKFLGMHFQGLSKWYMYKYYLGNKSFVQPRFVAWFRCQKYWFEAKLWAYAGKLGIRKTIKNIFKIKTRIP